MSTCLATTRHGGHRDGDVDRLGVAPVVVGHHALDPGVAVGGEESVGARQERRAGRSLLVGQDLGVGQPQVVVGEREDVVEPDLGLLLS